METVDRIDVKPIDASIVEAEEKQVVVLVSEANAFPALHTQADYLLAGELRSKLKGKIKRLEELRKSATVPLDTAKAIIMNWFKPVAARAEQGIEYLDELTIIYNEEQQRKAREAQAKADEEARKAREKAEAKARELEAQGKTEKAQAMQEKADSFVAPVIISTTPKVAGQAIKEVWYAEVTDFKALSDDYKLVNQSLLDKSAQASKGKLNIPGVVFKSRKIVSGRSI
jgi:Xaa-Pro aminopeptidase